LLPFEDWIRLGGFSRKTLTQAFGWRSEMNVLGKKQGRLSEKALQKSGLNNRHSSRRRWLRRLWAVIKTKQLTWDHHQPVGSRRLRMIAVDVKPTHLGQGIVQILLSERVLPALVLQHMANSLNPINILEMKT
jgi:hypothetical protein